MVPEQTTGGHLTADERCVMAYGVDAQRLASFGRLAMQVGGFEFQA